MERYKNYLEPVPSAQQARSIEIGNWETHRTPSYRYSQTKVIPTADNRDKERMITFGPGDETLGAYRMLRTKILRRLDREGWNTLAVTSPTRGNGKSLTAINLALSIASEANHSVVLVDLDLKNPSIAGFFGVKTEFGIVDHLTRGEPIPNILFNPGVDRMIVLPGRGSVSDSSDLLVSSRMQNLAVELRNRYASRVVIYDLPPVLQADDYLAFSTHLDAAVLVVEEAKTTQEEIAESLLIMNETPVLGLVINKSARILSTY